MASQVCILRESSISHPVTFIMLLVTSAKRSANDHMLSFLMDLLTENREFKL